MAKHSTLSFQTSFIASSSKNLKEEQLKDIQLNPSEAVIANILAFSKALRIQKSANTGVVEMVLN